MLKEEILFCGGLGTGRPIFPSLSILLEGRNLMNVQEEYLYFIS